MKLSLPLANRSVGKALAICLMVAAILPAQVCFAAATKAPAKTQKDLCPDFCLKVVYFIPSNRKPQQYAIERIKAFIKTTNKFYATEMARNGFYKPGTTQGKTFAYEMDKNGDPIVHIMKGKLTDVEYKDGPAQYGMVYDEVTKVFSVKRNTYIVWTEACRMLPDSSIAGPSCLGGAGEDAGGAGGVAILGSDGIYFLNTELFGDTRPIDGLVIPEVGQYPLKHRVSFGGFANPTVGGYASTCHGATSHELGHSFNLPHVFVNDYAPKIGGDLMGCGNQGFRGDWGNFPGEYTHLLKANCEMLNVIRAFNPGQPLTDTKPPKQTAEITLQNPMAEIGKSVYIMVKGSDPGSGLYRSIALVSPPWTTVKSAPFNSVGIAEYTIAPYEVPEEGLKPKSYNFELLAFDIQGNRSVVANWIPVPESLALQCMDGGDWRDIPNGWVSTSNTVRLAVSMTSYAQDVKVTPEVEVQPANKPFTGKPNFTGAAVEYKDKPVMGYVEMKLPAGSYHWRYRLTATSKDFPKSCWVQPRAVDSPGTDFVIPGK